jgi:helicase MOV-10
VKSPLAKEHGLEVSMIERLLKSPIYKKIDGKRYNPMLVTKLRDNFRSHEKLLYLPNKLFYDDQLRCCANPESVNFAQFIPWLPNGQFPIIFHHTM